MNKCSYEEDCYIEDFHCLKAKINLKNYEKVKKVFRASGHGRTFTVVCFSVCSAISRILFFCDFRLIIRIGQNMERRSLRKKKDLWELNDDELQEFMISMGTGSDEDYSSDDKYDDPAYAPDISSEFETSLNISDPLPAASSTFVNQEPSTSTAIAKTQAINTSSAKRPRSPLPALEHTGPSVVPSSGGFTSSLAELEKNSKEFSSVVWQKNI